MKPAWMMACLAAALLAFSTPAAAGSFDIDLLVEEFDAPFAPGDERSTDVQITVKIDAVFACATQSTVEIALWVEGTSEDFDGLVDPQSLELELDPGPHGVFSDDIVNSTWTESATFTAIVRETVPAGHTTHDDKVVASYDGTPPDGCEAIEWEEAEGSGSVALAIEFDEVTTQEEEDAGTNGTENGSDTQAGADESGESPLPGVAPLLLLVCAFWILGACRRTSR